MLENLITDRTAADVAARNAKGTYNAQDLNRVGEALAYLSQALNRYGYAQQVSARTSWRDTDWLDPNGAAALLRDLTAIREALTVWPDTPEVPKSMASLTYGAANDMERILLTVSELLRLLEQAQRRCGSFGFYAGAAPLPVWGEAAPPKLMRTWAELDQLGLTWADWDQMTWDQLLYG